MTICNILIPTYNRPDYLRRILDYYNENGKVFKMIVADSSSDENKKINKEIILSISNIDLKYLDGYSPKVNLHRKIADAVNYAEEKYCVICADDDFITPNGIKQSVDFLENNPDFTLAHGYYIFFYVETDIRKKQRFCWTSVYTHKSNTVSDAKSRLIEHLSNHSIPTFYAVHKTDFLKMIHKETLKYTNDCRFGELLPTMLTLIHGKMKHLDVLYDARDRDPYPRWSSTLLDFKKKGTYDEKYAKFRDCLSTHLSKNSQLDTEESEKVVDDAMSVYMEKRYRKTNHKMILVIKIKGRLPDRIYGGIRSVYRKLFPSKQIRTGDFQTSVDVSSSKYYDDFNKIRNHVLSYSKKG